MCLVELKALSSAIISQIQSVSWKIISVTTPNLPN